MATGLSCCTGPARRRPANRAHPLRPRCARGTGTSRSTWLTSTRHTTVRIDRLKALAQSLGRAHAPLEFGLRITTLVRDTTEEAWRDAEAKVAQLAASTGKNLNDGHQRTAVGQARLLDLADRGEVLDSCLFTTPGKFGAGGAWTTWLVGSHDEVAAALRKYQDLGITHFVLSDTPYRHEVVRIGDQLLSRLRAPVAA
ncbi:MAG TPA: LLM class flavin-dependent oxidoreductase [Streptosporangiaceae bacterium]|nr:LLM class flavin-dependent oxidoreductase [Streptosporangiaceae bacterium]